MPDTHNLKDKMFILVYSLRGLVGSKAEILWLKCMMELSCLLHGNQEAEHRRRARERERGWGQAVAFEAQSSVICFP